MDDTFLVALPHFGPFSLFEMQLISLKTPFGHPDASHSENSHYLLEIILCTNPSSFFSSSNWKYSPFVGYSWLSFLEITQFFCSQPWDNLLVPSCFDIFSLRRNQLWSHCLLKDVFVWISLKKKITRKQTRSSSTSAHLWLHSSLAFVQFIRFPRSLLPFYFISSSPTIYDYLSPFSGNVMIIGDEERREFRSCCGFLHTSVSIRLPVIPLFPAIFGRDMSVISPFQTAYKIIIVYYFLWSTVLAFMPMPIFNLYIGIAGVVLCILALVGLCMNNIQSITVFFYYVVSLRRKLQEHVPLVFRSSQYCCYFSSEDITSSSLFFTKMKLKVRDWILFIY